MAAARKYDPRTRRELLRRVGAGERPAAIAADLAIPAWTVSRIAREERRVDEQVEAEAAARRRQKQEERERESAAMRAWPVDFERRASQPLFLSPEHRYLYYEARRLESNADLLNFNDVVRGRPLKKEQALIAAGRKLFR